MRAVRSGTGKLIVLISIWAGVSPLLASAETTLSEVDQAIWDMSAPKPKEHVLLSWQPISRATRLIENTDQELAHATKREGQVNAKVFASTQPFAADRTFANHPGNPGVLLEIVLPPGTRELDPTEKWVMDLLRARGISLDQVFLGEAPIVFSYSLLVEALAIRVHKDVKIRLFTGAGYSDESLRDLAEQIPKGSSRATAMKVQLKAVFKARQLAAPAILDQNLDLEISHQVKSFLSQINRGLCDKVLRGTSLSNQIK